MLKKSLTAGTAVVLALSLAACGSSSSKTSPASSTTTPKYSNDIVNLDASSKVISGIASLQTPKVAYANYKLNPTKESFYREGEITPVADLQKETDEKGLFIAKYHEQRVYHPVLTAWFLNKVITSYKLSDNEEDKKAYMELLEKNIQMLIDGSEVDKKGSRWFTYKFAHAPGNLKLGTPWISGMAQGAVLSVLSEATQITNSESYQLWADQTFKSFLIPKYSQNFWFVNRTNCVAKDLDCVYFEEYPALTDDQNAHVINGHLYATLGLFDYYRLTKNERARELFNLGAVAIAESFDHFKYDGGISWYAATYYGHSLWVRPEEYHFVVIHQLEELTRITEDPRYAKMAQQMRSDYDK